ncbi:MAG: ATP-binding cassette domain-containing protein [Solirubrobacterales bacterium]|nr:ATP-binding cassette domain-containing protein [Solirubrobacterales bacterium]
MQTGVQTRADPGAAAAEAAAVALRGLRRDYGERPVLRDVTLELAAGETLSVIGPNGAGKSTLLRILATLLRPTAGRVAVLGAELPRGAWRVRGRIGYLAHQPLLYRELSVTENLEFNARLHGIDDPGRRIEELLGAAGLARRGGDAVRNLSAGMLQRAAICRALLARPDLLLLDEPRAHLDVGAARIVEELLGPAPGRTRVIVTHEIESGIGDADRVVALRADGSVAYAGAAAGLAPAEARAIVEGRQ